MKSFLDLIPDPFDVPWIDNEFMKTVEDEIITLKDYVPKCIEKALPDYKKRKKFVLNHKRIINDEFLDKQLIDQCTAGNTWEDLAKMYDEFFDKYPQYRSIIKNEEGYKEWKENNPFE